MIRVLDEGLDEVAAGHHQGSPLRWCVTAAVAVLCLFLLRNASLAGKVSPLAEWLGRIYVRILARTNPKPAAAYITVAVITLAGELDVASSPELVNALQGAALDVASPVGIPENFTLVLPSDGLHFPCRVVWRKQRRIGVVFE